VFERLTVIIDKKGIVRYMKDGSPNFEEILAFLKTLNEEPAKK
jgi:peroxiredoxin Q/BCP